MKKIAVLISGSGSNLRNLAEECTRSLLSKCAISVVVSNKEGVFGLKIAEEFGIHTVILKNIGKSASITSKNIKDYNSFINLKVKAEEEFLTTQKQEDLSFFEFVNKNKNLKKYSKGDGVFSEFFSLLLKHPSFINVFEREKYDEDLHQILVNHEVDYIFLAGFMRILGSSFVKKWENKIINIHPSLLPSFGGAKAVKEALEYGVKLTGVTVHYVSSGVDSGKIIAQKGVEVLDGDTEESLHERIKLAEKELYPKVLRDLINGKI